MNIDSSVNSSIEYFTTHHSLFDSPTSSLSTDTSKKCAETILKNFTEIKSDQYKTFPRALKVFLLKENKESKLSEYLDRDIASILINEEMGDVTRKACSEMLCSFDAESKTLVIHGENLQTQTGIERLVSSLPEDVLMQTRDLNIGSCYALTDLTLVLSKFENLEKLNLSGLKQLKSLSGIEKAAPTLVELTACETGLLRSIKELDKCTNLISLDLSGARLLDDLRPLKSLTGLRVLILDNCYKAKFYSSFLPSMSHLKTLSLKNNRNFKDTATLSGCRELENLDISGTPAANKKPSS